MKRYQTRWYTEAAQAGEAEAQGMLGLRLLQGKGAERNLTTGILWLRESANRNDPVGTMHLGLCMQSGEGVDKNVVEAARLVKIFSIVTFVTNHFFLS